MITPLVLIAVAVMSVGGGYVAAHEPTLRRRTASLAAAVGSIASGGFYIHLLQVYNSRPIEVFSRNPMAGLGPWDGLAMLLSFAAIIAAGLGAKKARLLLLTSSSLMLSYTLLTLVFWD